MKNIQSNWKIFFVDDSQIEINYLKLYFQLTDEPLVPTFQNSAPKALEILSNLEESSFPDIIVVDINMPLMDGFEFTKTYYKLFHDKYPDTLLFIYSTSIHSADIKKAESIVGASRFIPKPFMDNTFRDYIYPHLPITGHLSDHHHY